MKKFLALMLALVMVFALCACGSSSTTTTTTTTEAAPAAEAATTEAAPAEAAAKTKIALVIPAGDHGFTGESIKHAEMEAEKLMAENENLEIVVKSQGEPSGQITEIENLIAMGDVSAIMLWPNEGEALRSAAQTILDAGIKLVVYDRLITGLEGIEAQMMGDNFFIGGEMGKYLNEYYKDYESVQYLRFVGDSSTVTEQRSGGMDEVIDAKFEQVNETFVTDWSSEKAQEQFENWLNGNDKATIEALDLIVTHDDEIINGLMNAMDAYAGDADLNGIKLMTSVGGIDATCQKFENTKYEVKFTTFFFAPSFIRECVDYTADVALGKDFTGTAVYDEETDCWLIPSFSISNAGNATYTFDEYRASEEYATRYSIGDF